MLILTLVLWDYQLLRGLLEIDCLLHVEGPQE